MPLMMLEGFVRRSLIEADSCCKNCFLYNVYSKFNCIHPIPKEFKCAKDEKFLYCPMYGIRMPYLKEADGLMVDVDAIEEKLADISDA